MLVLDEKVIGEQLVVSHNVDLLFLGSTAKRSYHSNDYL